VPFAAIDEWITDAPPPVLSSGMLSACELAAKAMQPEEVTRLDRPEVPQP
jgi:hypothetical protein